MNEHEFNEKCQNLAEDVHEEGIAYLAELRHSMPNEYPGEEEEEGLVDEYPIIVAEWDTENVFCVGMLCYWQGSSGPVAIIDVRTAAESEIGDLAKQIEEDVWAMVECREPPQ